MAVPAVVAVLANATAITTTTNGSAVALGSPVAVTCNQAIAICNVSTVTNGAGQTITIEGSSDGGTTWATVGTFGVSTVASGYVGVRTGVNVCYLTGGVPPLLRWKNVAQTSASIVASIYVIGLQPNDSVEATKVPGAGGYGSSLRFLVQPTSVVHGAHSISPTVTVQVIDYLGNVCASDSATAVTLTIVPAAGSASGVLTGTIPATASSGVASFADLQISLTGQYTLVATATGLTSATSVPFPATAS